MTLRCRYSFEIFPDFTQDKTKNSNEDGSDPYNSVASAPAEFDVRELENIARTVQLDMTSQASRPLCSIQRLKQDCYDREH